MSHVWVSIAMRAPCSPARAQPLLQLFSGYARSQVARYGGRPARSTPRDVSAVASSRTPRAGPFAGGQCGPVSGLARRAFVSTPLLAARTRPARPPPPRPYDSGRGRDQDDGLAQGKVEPAPTVASHTEGVPPEDDGVLTWRDYDPEGGMPLPRGELSAPELHDIFGTEDVNVETGNYILSVMHWRRMSGALIDSGLDFPKRSGVTREQALKGLQYVRTLVPGFDEHDAGQRWAEEESLRLQDEIRQRSIKLGLYKPDPEEEELEKEESRQGTEYGRAKSKESALQQIRKENEAAWEQEQAEAEAQKQRDELAALHAHRGPLELSGGVQPTVALTTTGPGGVTIGPAPTSGWLAPVERKPWVKYYEEQAMTIKENILPRISIFGRLAPSFLVMLAVVGLCLAIPDNYTPPPPSARIWPDTPPAVATLGTLTGILAAAFVISRLPPVWKTLNKYFTIVPAYPYAFSLVGATFRHDTLTHVCANLVPLWLFGLLLHEDVGRGTFLAIFFASGAVGGFASLAYNVLRKQWMTYVFGSSGSVLGVVAAACTLRPNGKIQIAGYEIPVAAWMFLALYGGAEAVAAARGLKTTIDHAGHLGGILAGICGGLYLRQRAGRGVDVQRRVVERE